MNIVFCGVKSIPNNCSGISRVTEELSKIYVRLGHNVKIYCRNNESSMTQNYKGAQIVNISYLNNKYLCYSSYLLNAIKLITHNENKESIIHLHTPETHGFGVYILKKLGYTVLCHTHGMEWRSSKWPRWFKILMKLNVNIALKNADTVICVSKEEKDYYINKNRSHNDIHHVPNGVLSLKNEFKLGITELWNNIESFYLFAGRIVPQKGVLEIIRAFQLIDTKRKLLIIGNSSYTSKYYSKIEKLCSKYNNVILKKSVHHDTLMNYYRNCFAFILPSEQEGCPNVILESIANRCICVVSNIKPHVEIGGDGFLYVKPRNIEDLVDILEYLEASFHNWNIYKDKAMNIYTSLLSWEIVASKIINLYNNALGESTNLD